MSAWRARLRRLPGPGRLRRFGAALGGPHRASALRGVLDGAWVALILRRRGVAPLMSGLDGDAGGAQDSATATEVAAAVDAGLGLVPVAPTCLRRSVTLVRELQRRGLAGVVHVGVRPAGDRIEAHAWVQVDDVVVNDEPEVVDRWARIAAGELERMSGAAWT